MIQTKKGLIGLITAIVVIFGGYFMFKQVYYGGTQYYTRITTDGRKITQTDQRGNHYVDYQYNQAAYDQDGKAKTIKFDGNKPRPLHHGAYLQLTYNQEKGVTKWESVTAKRVPAKDLAHLK
ncbi:YxeA family protein [Lacticaseibacillus pabuli]|uniref:YxeA family protein n=1 Tax=Lacticaseibacillus pabuli TaxID=3025672 RepID=A0ABY7WUF0_9LACO|nr:YxeA family protein [Lacticaseibacillus sp. KACC 23028]WDF83802.1 YxeA family protein [Lacticaseibacillus sp. KACC 23028]